jgi:hypothetical protein
VKHRIDSGKIPVAVKGRYPLHTTAPARLTALVSQANFFRDSDGYLPGRFLPVPVKTAATLPREEMLHPGYKCSRERQVVSV